MSDLIRFGVAMDKPLLEAFDSFIRKKGYKNRSEAIRDLVRKELLTKDIKEDEFIYGTILFVYNHHKKELVNKLIEIQHDFEGGINSSVHVHLDHDNCLEVVILHGQYCAIKKLVDSIKPLVGVRFAELVEIVPSRIF